VRSESTSLRTYLLTRLALAIPTALILLTMVFLLMRVAPGDPIQAALGGHVSQQEIEKRRQAAGYDRPIVVQYVNYLGDALTLNLGDTLSDHRSVTSIIVDNGSATLELTIYAFTITLLVGVSIGLVAGRYRDTWADIGGRMFGIVIYAAPVFFLGFLFQLLFGSTLGWLPTTGRVSPLTEFELNKITHIYTIDAIIGLNWNALQDVLLHMILPAVTLGLVISGVMIRQKMPNSLSPSTRAAWASSSGRET